MLTYIDASGNLVKTVPEKIYQGSNLANTIYLVGAYPQASVVTIAFKLPQTGHYTEPYIMLNANIPTEIGLNAWSFDLPVAITEYYGKVEFQVTIYGGTKTLIIDGVETPVPVQIKSAYGTFEVEKGVQVDASQIQAPNVYDQILQLISQIQAQINDHSLVAMGILPYSNAFEYPLNALTYYNGNLYRSLQAQNVDKPLDNTEWWEEWDLSDITDLLARVGALETTVSGFDGRITQAQTDATSALTKVGRIKVVDNQNGSFTFTNGENQDTTIECSGSNPDNETIVLNDSDELEAVAIKDGVGTITPSDVRAKQNATDNNLLTTDKTIVGAINEVDNLAKGRTFARTYNSISDMVTALNTMDENTLKTGDNIYIVTEDVPDLWIGKVESLSSIYTYTTDSAFISAITGSLSTTVQVGYYRLLKLESEKVDLSNVVDSNSTITDSGAGNVVTGLSIDNSGNVTLTKSITAPNNNEVVHLADAETITGVKTFDNQVNFSNSGAAGTNNLSIKNDNGYNAKIKMGSTENMRLMTGGTYFGATAGVVTDNAYDLGASGTAWKDFYLKGKIALDNYIIDKDAFGQLQIRNANTTSMQFDGSTVRSQNIVPMANNQKDLGSSSMKWKDLYLSGNLSDGTNSISVAQILTSGAFKSLNLTSTTLSADELSTIQNYNVVLQSDITLGSGTTLHAQTILTKPFSYSNTLRGLYIDNSKVGTYLIDTNTNTLGQGAQDIVLNGLAQINSKAIPSYPNDNNTYYLEYVNGTLTWVQDNTVKVNTISYSTKRVYGQNAVGAEQMIQISPNAYGQFLVERDSNGMFNVNEPTLSTHPASKNYVDTAIASAITTALNTPV